MLLRNAVIPMGNEFVSDMCVRLENGCIAEIGKDLAAISDETISGSSIRTNGLPLGEK